VVTENQTLIWVASLLVIAFLGWLLLRRRRPDLGADQLIEETKRAAAQAAFSAAQEAQAAVIAAHTKQTEEYQRAQKERRRESAARASETRAQRIEQLQQWREPFVAFVRRLAEPYFKEWDLEDSVLEHWAEERADFYIKQKPYILQVVQSVHADALRAAEKYANQGQKSPREIARQRAKGVSRALTRNSECPYCGIELDERAHLDHIVPVQRGGPSEPWNMVFACIQCNRAKRDLSLMEFVDTDYARKHGLKVITIVKRLKELDKYFDVIR